MNSLSSHLQLAESLLPDELLRALREDNPTAELYGRANDMLARYFQRVQALAPPYRLLSTPLSSGAQSSTYLRGTLMAIRLVFVDELLKHAALQGPEATEGVGTALSEALAVIIDAIERCGGEVIAFGGETLTAIFAANQLGSDHAALAVHAALATQQQFSAARANPGHALQVRITVQAGSFFMVDAGDQHHRQLLLMGRAVYRAMRDRDTTPIGAVSIISETGELVSGIDTRQLNDHLQLVDRLTSQPALPSPAPVAMHERSLAGVIALLEQIDRAQRYLPFQLPARLISLDTLGGEFRPVTAAVVSFNAYRRLIDLLEVAALIEQDSTIVARVVDSYFTATQAVIHRYGGWVAGLETSGSGDRLYTFFGAPVAHEDDPYRAVAAHLEMRAQASGVYATIRSLIEEWTADRPQQSLLLRLAQPSGLEYAGLASGILFAGMVGTQHRRAYSVIGQADVTAAQLMAAAEPGHLLLAASTQRAVRPLISADALPPVLIGRDNQMIEVFRLPGQHGPGETARVATLVGRQAQLAQLRAAADAALAIETTTGQVVALLGEAGIGKTRLVEELWAQLRISHPHSLLLRVSCRSYEQERPHAAFIQLFRELFQITLDDDGEMQAYLLHHLLEALVPDWSRFSPLLGEMLGIPIPETQVTRALTPEQRSERLNDLAIETLLATANSQPIALAIEDTHWLDHSSAAMLHQLAERTQRVPMLLIMTSRPAEDRATPWQDLPDARIVSLTELDTAASDTLLAELFATPPPPELLPLLARAQGVPLYLEELVRYLIGKGVIRRQPRGSWQLTSALDGLRIPAQVEQLIAAQLDRLSDSARQVAEVASVAGVQFVLPVVERIIGSDTLNTPLAELRQSGFLTTQISPASFRHAITRDAVYGSLSLARRRLLHAQIGAAIEQLYAANLAEHHAALGDHFQRGELPDRAYPHVLAAARQAQARHANHEALALYTKALALAPWQQDEVPPSPYLIAPLHEGFGDVLALTGSYSSARDQYGLLLTLYDDAPRNNHAKAKLLRKVAGTFESQGNFDTALDRLTQALALIAQAAYDDTALTHAEITSDIGWIHYRRGDIDQAKLFIEHAQFEIESAEITPQIARIYTRLGGIAWSQGDLATAQQYVEQSLAVSEQSGDLIEQARSLNNLSLLLDRKGEYRQAAAYGMRSIEQSKATGNRREIALSSLNVGWSLYNAGDAAQALALLTQAVAYAVQVRDSYHHMLALLNIAIITTELQRFDEAEQSMSQAKFIAEQLQIPAHLLEVHTILAELAFSQGDLSTANQEQAHAQAFVAHGNTEEYGRFQRLSAKLAYAQGATPRALELLNESARLFQQLDNTPEVERTRRLLAEYDVAAG
ncbi:MAG: AAA family ATPase [Roseiflexaceae bacterium]|nr:AAA family ATPase [Roseiflexaceae bacterium]